MEKFGIMKEDKKSIVKRLLSREDKERIVTKNCGKTTMHSNWEKDKKKGRGTAHFTDGSIYEGDFDNDVFEGMGKFIWKAGHVYIGAWKQGRMEGEGEFKHQDGHILRGIFKNNYMYDKEKNL